MPKVRIYSTRVCPYCHMAARLLQSKGVQYEQIYVDIAPEKRQEMLRLANGSTTVPQIFIDDYHVGGYRELARLDLAGELDGLLGSAEAS